MDQQRAHIDIALSADMAELAAVPGAELARRHAQPGAKLATTGKALGLTDGGRQGAGSQQPDTTDLIQFAHDVIVSMPALELLFTFGHALFVQVDLGQDDMQQAAQGREFRLLNQLTGSLDEGCSRGRRFDTRFTQHAAQQVDALGAALLPGFPQPVQLLKLLLIVALYRHGMNVCAARSFEHGIAVSRSCCDGDRAARSAGAAASPDDPVIAPGAPNSALCHRLP